jgi:hypothetical protein
VNKQIVEFHVPTKVAAKCSSVFWHIMSCSPVKFNGLFGGKYLQGRGVSQERDLQVSYLVYSSILNMEAMPVNFSGLHDVISHNMQL